jgi:NAD(P)-dependent dehydrogenase (short-subunit alcohol dehydrogenase family)
VAIVTGGAHGIGRAIVKRLVRDGMRVAFIDIDVERGEAVAEDAGALFVPGDVAREHDVQAAVVRIESELGGVDALVNNAGVNAYFDAASMTEDQWDTFFDLDLKAAWLCAKCVLPIMRASGDGAIVNISSIHSTLTAPGTFPYAAAKAGLIGLTRSLALDVGVDGIRVNAVCPGYIKTRLLEDWFRGSGDPEAEESRVAEMHALRRVGTADDVAGLVSFLISPDAGFITGASIAVDGGLSARFATPEPA